MSLPDVTIHDQTQAKKNQSKFFNQVTSNAIYPAECDDSDLSSSENILDASFIIDHMSLVTRSNQRLRNDLHGSDLNDTIVDEELIMNLSQWSETAPSLNETLNEEESDVLDILRRLEEQEEQGDKCVEDDSILAPFTQRANDLTASLSQHRRKQEQNATLSDNCDTLEKRANEENDQSVLKRSFADDYFNDSDDDLLNDFSMCLDTLTSEG